MTVLRNPVAEAAAAQAISLIDGALPPAVGADPRIEPDRPALALAALLAGYVIGSTWYGLHHVLSRRSRASPASATGPRTRSCSRTRSVR